MFRRGWVKLFKSLALSNTFIHCLCHSFLKFKMNFWKDAHSFTGTINLSAQYTSDEQTLPDFVIYGLIGLYFLALGINVAGNLIIVALFLFKKRQKTNANCYHVAIAISDILLVLWCVPLTASSLLLYRHTSWIHGELMCSVIKYIPIAWMIQRSFTFMASSLERYNAIRRPFKKKQTSRRALICIVAAICITSLILPVPVARFAQIVFYDDNNDTSICVEVWPNNDFRGAFRIIIILLTYLLPLLVWTITSWRIVLILDAKPPGEEHAQLVRRRYAIKRKAIRTLLLTFCAYAVCWLPVNVITLTGDVTPVAYDKKTGHVLCLFVQLLAVSYSAINPIIVLTSSRSQMNKHVCCQNEGSKGNVAARQRKRCRTSQILTSNQTSGGCTINVDSRWRGSTCDIKPAKRMRSNTQESYV